MTTKAVSPGHNAHPGDGSQQTVEDTTTLPAPADNNGTESIPPHDNDEPAQEGQSVFPKPESTKVDLSLTLRSRAGSGRKMKIVL